MWPYFAELGKNAMDIFASGYSDGTFNLGVKSKTSTDVEISSNIVTDLKTQNTFGTLQNKYKSQYGTYVLKLDTDNRFSSEITFADLLVKETQISLQCSFSPQEGYKFGRLKGYYTNVCSLSADIDPNLGNPTLSASAVSGCYPWLVGVNAMLDLKNKKMIGNSIAVGYIADDFVFHSAWNNGNELRGSFYQKVNPDLEIGIKVAASSESNESQLGIGCRYKLDPEVTLYGKGDSRGQIGLGYQQKLHEGITLCLSTLYNISDSNIGVHKLGISLNFEL